MKTLKLILAAILLFSLSACAVVPGTGRSQLSLVDDAELNQASSIAYRQVIQQGPLSKDKKATEMIKRVGGRIAAAAEQYLADHGLADEAKKYRWEFNLIQSKEVNAWCMAGGKVAFYTGILPYCQGEDGVATVMGHEVAHAIARHSNERASQQMVTELGGSLLGLGLGLGGAGSYTAEMAMTAYGVGTELGVLLPFSRAHESEADRIGLTLMAMAGYNPEAAVPFWERMAGDESGGSDFFSTHPSGGTRISDLRKYMPEAQARYKPAGGKK